jgi:predicted metal-dependent hydrolase
MPPPPPPATSPFRNQPLLTAEELSARIGEFHKAVEEFNDRYYFESHETLEDLWMVTPWPDRQFFQGIIQLAAAFVHFVRGEYPGIIKLLDGASEKLAEFAPERFGVDVAALLEAIARARSELVGLGEGRFRDWDESRVPMIVVQPRVHE